MATQLSPPWCWCRVPFPAPRHQPSPKSRCHPCTPSIPTSAGSVSSLGHKPDLPLPFSTPLSVFPGCPCSINKPRAQRTNLQPLLQKPCAAIRSIGKFIWEAPVTNKEYKGLKNRERNTWGQCQTVPSKSKLPVAPAQKTRLSKALLLFAANHRTRGGYGRCGTAEYYQKGVHKGVQGLLHVWLCPARGKGEQTQTAAQLCQPALGSPGLKPASSISTAKQEKRFLLSRTKGNELPNSSHI